MRIELQQLDQIDAYLNGSMNAETKAIFEKEMQQSAELRQLVENQQLMIRSIQRQALLAEINQFSTPNTLWTITKWLSVGIVVAGLISAGIWWKSAKNNEPVPLETQEITVENTTETIEEVIPVINSDTSVTTETQLLPGQPIPQATEPLVLDQKVSYGNTENGQSASIKPYSKEFAEAFRSDAVPVKNLNDPYDVGGLKTWIMPQRQYFNIDPERGATIECKDGTLIIVPSDAFIDEKGTLITKQVELEIVEALSVADMLAYNLTTMNNEKHLQSGGMIYVQPTVKGKKVNINPERPLYIEVPTDQEVPNMLAWKGETNAGNINWTEPKALEKFLTPVKFELLDFLPVGFAEEVEAALPFRKHKVISKKLTDSLYYSLADVNGERWSFNPMGDVAKEEIVRIRKNTYALGGIVIEEGTKDPVANAKVILYNFNNQEIIDSVFTNAEGNFITKNMKDQNIFFKVECNDYSGYKSPELILPLDRLLTFQPAVVLKRTKPKDMAAAAKMQINTSVYKDQNSSCMIDPLSVKAIKTREFSKTFLATREFEARIKVLHQMPNAQNLLEIYVNNLSGNLWEADSLVALKLTGDNKVRFDVFASEKHTNVKNKNIYQDQLSQYYNEKRGEYEANILKMRGEYKAKNQQELAKLSDEISAVNQSYSSGAITQPEVIEAKETEMAAFQPNPAISNSYAVSWYQPGWVNLDCYNNTLASGSKDVNISVNQDSARVYQSINPMKIIIPLNANAGKALAKFPRNGAEGSEEMKNAFCIGIRKENKEVSYAEEHYDPYSNEEVQLEWVKMTEKQFYSKLKALPYSSSKFASIIKTQEAEVLRRQALALKQEQLALEMRMLRERIAQENAFIDRLLKIAGSCGIGQKINSMGDIVEDVDDAPNFPGGSIEIRKFLAANVKFPEKMLDQNINGKVYARFVVETDGSITNIRITRSMKDCPECDAEVIRVIQLMPKWIPGKANGKPVASYFDLPVKFEVSGATL